jgi:hypothetical protein
MEMHSRQSLYEVHGLNVGRRRRRSRLTARLFMRRIGAFLTKVKLAIEAELVIRRAMSELAVMDDRMLRDLGIERSEIEGLLRWPRAHVGADEALACSNIGARSHPDLPTVTSPLIVSGGRPDQEARKLHSWWSS